MIDFDATVLAACEASFAQPIVYVSGEGVTYAGQVGAPLLGIFEQSLKEIRPNHDGILVDTARPILGLRVSSLRAAGVPADRLPTEAELILTTTPPCTWTIANAEPPDSEGHMRLALMRTGV